jgi:hypothetical protein
MILLWLQAEMFHTPTEEETAMSKVDALLAGARELIAECLQRQALEQAMRQGVRVRPSGSATMTCSVDPALLERTRCVAQGDAVRIEQLDGEGNWREVWRSAAAPAASPPPAPEPIPEQSSRFGPPVRGQLIVKDGRFAWAE